MKAESDKIRKLYLEFNMFIEDMIPFANSIKETEDAISNDSRFLNLYRDNIIERIKGNNIL